MHLLGQVIPQDRKSLRSGKGKALVVSLRDDEGMARKTMSKILLQQFEDSLRDLWYKDPANWAGLSQGEKEAEALACLRELEANDCLEILYYPPGYITPEEFFHRLFLSIRRLKHLDGRPVTLLFNSLDQLGARFPLCASEKIFIPGLIEMLMAEAITSIFVAVTEPGQPEEQYGVLPMADLILQFGYQTFSQEFYEWLLRPESRSTKAPPVGPGPGGPKVSTVVLQVRRMPGGLTAGRRGILELVEQSNRLYHKPGLHFTEIPE